MSTIINPVNESSPFDRLPTRQCNCDSCALTRVFREPGLKDLPADEVAFMVYWAVTCARCGGQLKWNGFFDDMAVCEKCDLAMTAESNDYEQKES